MPAVVVPGRQWRWPVIDLAIWIASLLGAILLRFDFHFESVSAWSFAFLGLILVLHLAAGLTIGPYAIGHVEQDTELARTVRDEGLGWSVSAGDTPAVVAAITDAQTRRANAALAPMVDRVRRYAETHFAEEAVLDRWAALLAEIIAERKAG